MLSRIKSLSLTARIISAVIVILLVVVTVNYVVFLSGFRDSAVAALEDKAAAFTAVADEAKNHVGAMGSHGDFATEELLAELKEFVKAGKPYTEARIFETIPVVAGWTTAEKAAARENIEFRVTSFDARNKTNEPKPGSFEAQLLTDLTNQVDSGGSEILSRIDEESNTLHYMRAIRLTEDCLMCHGDAGNEWDTDGDGKDVLGFTMEGWDVGYMHGTYHVVMPLSVADGQVASFLKLGLSWSTPLILAGVGLFLLMMRFMFSKPVKELLDRIRDIAQGEGDLTKRIDVKSEDEIGQLGKWFNVFVQKVHDVVADVAGATAEVASASTEIAASAEQTSEGMKQQTEQTTQVASAVEQMSSSVIEVSRKSGETVKAADEAGSQASEGNQVVQQTVEGMNAIAEVVNASANAIAELGKRGEQIGQIIGVINNIAEQTNLLALNAAIEAARAGEHGRGFAVVADEVRKLAESTTQATEEVAESIRAIQDETNSAVTQMNKGTERVREGVQRAESAGQSLQAIMESSGEVARMIQSIAAAAEEQSAVAEEISRNVDSINAVTRQSAEGADQASSAAMQLSTKSEQLQALVGQFKIDQTAKQAA